MPDTPWDSPSWLIRRGVRRVVHFHVDHFEPGRADGSGAVMGMDHVQRWLNETDGTPWGRKAATFYKSMWLTKITPESAAKRIEKDVPVWEVDGQHFTEHSFGQDDEIVQALLAARDFHVHVHHEHWTSGPITGTQPNPRGDAERLSSMLDWLLERYEGFGMAPKGWGFIHGAWALNASDKRICQIADELQILMDHGCYGDFTFPAGREWCDPDLKVPFTIRPLRADKCYDLNMAQPMRLESGAYAAGPGRILVWSQAVHTNMCSFDNICKAVDGRLMSEQRAFADRVILAWGQYGWVHPGNNTLYIKTHAHSLMDGYWKTINDHNSPLTSDPIKWVFHHLDMHCRDFDVKLEFKNVREVMQEIHDMDRRVK